jgi:hypothetical protein
MKSLLPSYPEGIKEKVKMTTAWAEICSCNLCIHYIRAVYAGGRAMQEQLPKGKIHFPYFAYPSPNLLSGEALFALYEIVTNDIVSILEGHIHQHQFALRQLYLIIST